MDFTENNAGIEGRDHRWTAGAWKLRLSLHMHHHHAITESVRNPFAGVGGVAADELVRQYDNLSAPRNAADLARLRGLSAEAFGSGLDRISRRFGAAAHERVDVFLPALSGGTPVGAVLFVHGGRWRVNTSLETAFWARASVAQGWAFVGLNVPKLGEVGLGAVIESLARTIAAVFDAAPTLGIDAASVALAGHSSGAHLALAAALGLPQGSNAGALAPWTARLRAIYLLSGIYDLRPLLCTASDDALGFGSQEAQACSPLLRLEDGASLVGLPPVRVAVGAAESPEFLRQARALHCALQRTARSEFHEIAGAAHFDAALEFNAPASASRAFVRQHLSRAG